MNEVYSLFPICDCGVICFFFKQKTAYEMRISDWSSDVCSSDLRNGGSVAIGHPMGASGTRIVATLIGQLRSRGGGIGIAAICGGYGQGEAIMIKVDHG